MFEELLTGAGEALEPAQYFYYGIVDAETHSYGFLEEGDERITEDMIKLSADEWQELLDKQSEGLEIAVDNGRVIAAERGRYYIDDNGQWQKRSDEEFETKIAQEKVAALQMLSLTAADVERALYKAKGMDFEDIIALCEAQPLNEGETPAIDVKALKIELKANNFYRGNPYVEQIGKLLGFTDEQLNAFFEDGNYEHLL